MQILKKNLKRIAAVGIGAAMLGMTMSGALAATYTLGDYPTPFTGKDAVLVVGAAADASDSAAMEDVAFGLGSVKTTTGTTSTGTALTFEDGELQDIQVGTALNNAAAFGVSIDDSDDVGLVQGELNIDLGSDKDYDFHEEMAFTADAKLSTALGMGDEDFGDKVVIAIPDEALNYSYIFEDALDSGNYLNDSSSSDTIDLKFLGKDLTIRGASNTSLTAVVGDKITLSAGEAVKVGTHTIKFIKATATKALIEVDGESYTESEGSVLDKKGVEVYVDSVFDEEDPTKETAVLVIGEQAVKTFSNNDAYWDEDDQNPLWKWSLSSLSTSAPSFGVTLAEDLDDANDPLVSEITDLGLLKSDKAYLGVGDYLCLPHQYACVVFDSMLGDMAPKDLTFDVKKAEKDIYNAAGSAKLGGGDNVHGIFVTSNYASDKGLVVNGEKTGSMFVWYNTTTKDAWVFSYDKDNGYYVNSTVDVLNGTQEEIATTDFGDFDVSILLGLATDPEVGGWNVTVRAVNAASDLSFNGTADGTEGFYFIGAVEGQDTGTYLHYGTTSLDSYTDTVRSDDGVVIYSPESNIDKDMVKLGLPNDNEFKANLRIAMPTGSASSTTTTTAYTKMKDTEVLDTLTSYNVITVGGPAVNKVTAKLMGKEFPAVGANSGIAEGKALLEVLPNGAKWALVVAGWEKDNTLAASSLLKNYADNSVKFAGKATVVVSGTTASGVTFE